MDVISIYQSDIALGHIQFDPAQHQILLVLNALKCRLEKAGDQPRKIPFWRFLPWVNVLRCGDREVQHAHIRWQYRQLPPANVSSTDLPSIDSATAKGLYIWGGVGRGKTYVMDLFFNQVNLQRKKRYHFHRFMQVVHAGLKTHQGETNPLVKVAENIAKEARLLCLDEFFVTDISDAMILSGLLHALFAYGVCLVTTSNLPPENLYQDGLQRARFLPAIALLQQASQVLSLSGEQDYRLQALTRQQNTMQRLGVYHWPLDAQGQQRMQDTFDDLITGHVASGGQLLLLGREIPVIARAGELIWLAFSAICEGPRSVHDYIELATHFHTILISGVPQFTADNDEAAKRFIYLVDEFYDRGVKLILLAAVAIDQLYQGSRLVFEFERTQSRLIEMQTPAYLHSSRM